MNKKGFTLVELLAVIVILGLLLALATLTVTAYLNAAKEASFKSLVQSIEASAELYIIDNSGKYPQLDVAGSVFDIELKDLVDNNYIKDKIIDERRNENIPLTSKVTINVIGNNKIEVDFIYE